MRNFDKAMDNLTLGKQAYLNILKILQQKKENFQKKKILILFSFLLKK